MSGSIQLSSNLVEINFSNIQNTSALEGGSNASSLPGIFSGSPPPNSYVGDALIVPFRAIGYQLINVLMEELNRDDLEITQHPVDRRAPITDHAFKRPMEVSLRVGWSNSGNYPGYVNDVYDRLRTLQESRVPFDVYTGKRFYTSMLMASLIQTSSAEYGDNTLVVQAVIREIQLVDTLSVQLASKSEAEPKKTAAVSDTNASKLKGTDSATATDVLSNSATFNGVEAMPVTPSDTSATGNRPGATTLFPEGDPTKGNVAAPAPDTVSTFYYPAFGGS